MKLRYTNQIEISYANAKAIVEDFERKLAEGRTSPESMIYKVTEGATIALTIVADEDHYTEGELSDRRSPYLAPEAWAGK
jgi:hypothetical protein